MKMSTTHNIEMHKLHVFDVQKVEITYIIFVYYAARKTRLTENRNDIVNRLCFIKANDSVPMFEI